MSNTELWIFAFFVIVNFIIFVGLGSMVSAAEYMKRELEYQSKSKIEFWARVSFPTFAGFAVFVFVASAMYVYGAQ